MRHSIALCARTRVIAQCTIWSHFALKLGYAHCCDFARRTNASGGECNCEVSNRQTNFACKHRSTRNFRQADQACEVATLQTNLCCSSAPLLLRDSGMVGKFPNLRNFQPSERENAPETNVTVLQVRQVLPYPSAGCRPVFERTSIMKSL